MTKRKKPGRAVRYSEDEVRRWLAWLGRGMRDHGQTIFLLEELQPSWLRAGIQRWSYMIVTRFAAAFVLLVALTAVLADTNFVMLAGMAVLLAPLLAIGDRRSDRVPRNRGWQSLGGRVLTLVCLMVLFFVVANLFAGEGFGIDVLMIGFGWGFPFALFWTFGSLAKTENTDIRVTETLGWSWRLSLSGAIVGALGIAISTAVFMIGVQQIMKPLIQPSYDALPESLLLAALIGSTIGLLFGGLRGRRVEPSLKTLPNSGMRLTLEYSLLVVAGFVAMGVAVYFLFSELELGLKSDGNLRHTQIPVSYGLIAVLWYGGLDVIKHIMLRLILVATGATPWRYARFLDFAAEELGFLQKVGSGYMFSHRILLEHFAEMEEPSESGGQSAGSRGFETAA